MAISRAEQNWPEAAGVYDLDVPEPCAHNRAERFCRSLTVKRSQELSRAHVRNKLSTAGQVQDAEQGVQRG